MEPPTRRLVASSCGVAVLVISLLSPAADAWEATGRLSLIEVSSHQSLREAAGSGWVQVYFEVPIATEHQVPVRFELSADGLVDYRFVRWDPPNVVVSATLETTLRQAEIDWKAWVLVRTVYFFDRPEDVPLVDVDDPPEEALQWLQPSDVAQTWDPLIQGEAAALREVSRTTEKLGDNVARRAWEIRWDFMHFPHSYDAYYALRWGNSCTGHGHAAAALLRANGLAARNVHAVPVPSTGVTMHWFVDYLLPGYGWLSIEPSMGWHPISPQQGVIFFVNTLADEFPVFMPHGFEEHWFVSDRTMAPDAFDWGSSHDAREMWRTESTPEKVAEILELAAELYQARVELTGTRMTAEQAGLFSAAAAAEDEAFAHLAERDLEEWEAAAQSAQKSYRLLRPLPEFVVYEEDFDHGAGGWTHGGNKDQWELGSPSYGPDAAHSGSSCWGTDLDDTYDNLAHAWLLSPVIDLSDLASASMSFWAWISVQDHRSEIFDPLWLEISTDGVTFESLCGEMGGVNDDSEIPAIGGWSRVVLDLGPYVGHEVRLRYWFRSDGSVEYAGAYLDDVLITGRPFGADPAHRRSAGRHSSP